MDGKEISTNGKTNAELEIDIVNGRDIPTGESEMTSLAKTIASDLKNSLKDRAEYNTYKVLFVTRYRDGGVTRKNWKGQVFKSGEL